MSLMSTKELLALQTRVIGALVLRETRGTFGASQFGYLWAIITPSLSIAVFVGIFSFVGRSAPFGPSLILFFATGLLTLEFFNKLSASLMNAFVANRTLLTYPPMKETDALFARLILITVTYVLIMLLFYGNLILLGLTDPPHSIFIIMQAIGCAALLGFGFGTLNAVLISLWSSWSHIEKILTRPLLLISGIFYVPSFLPPEAVAILQWNPVIHLVEWVRMGFYPNYFSSIFDPRYPLFVAMILILFGLAGERIFRKKRV